MSWSQYGIFAVIGLYTFAVLICAPYLARRSRRYKNPTIREKYRQTFLQLRRSLVICIALFVINAFFFLPSAFSGSSFFAIFGVIMSVGALVFLLLWRYLTHIILSLEKGE